MDKKPEDMTIDELKEYKDTLEKEKLLRETAELEKDKVKANEKTKAEETLKIQTDAVEEFKKAELKRLAEEDPGSAEADVDTNLVQNAKVPVNLEVQAVEKKLNNELERNRAVLNIPENRKLENLSYEEQVKRLKSGYYKKP